MNSLFAAPLITAAFLASDDCPLFAAIFVLAAGSILYGFFFLILRNKRLAENLPTSTCRAAPMGLVEVKGRAVGAAPIRSPFAGIPCFCSRVVIQEWTRISKNEGWSDVYRKTFSTPFYVDDGTGRVRVEPAGAEISLTEDFSFDNSAGLKDTPGVRERLAQAGRTSEQLAQRLREFCTAPQGSERDHLVPQETRCSIHQQPKARGDLTARVFALGLHFVPLLHTLRQELLAGKPRATGGERPLRVREENLCPGDPVYVLGTASEVQGMADEFDRIVICRSEVHPWFVIGEGSQKEVLARMTRGLWLVGAVGIGLLLVGVAMLVDCTGL